MSKVEVTVDELVAVLQHSNVPTLIAEGRDDIIVLRKMEDKFSNVGLSVLPAGGRSAVLGVFDRRNELKCTAKTLFFVDKDTWVYGNVPDEYISSDLKLTDGYSIENDMYQDGDWESLLRQNEKANFYRDLDDFISWYALALYRQIANPNLSFAHSPEYILGNGYDMNEFLQLKYGEAYPQKLYEEIRGNYTKLLRGKALLALILRQLSHKKRDPKHSGKSLLEYGASREGECINRINQWIYNQIDIKS